MQSRKQLFEEDSSEEEEEKVDLKINKSYAENYEQWRRKEEYQKLKDKYANDDLDSESESSTDTEYAGTENAEFDMDFYRVLAALRTKHPIVNEDGKFFKDSYEFQAAEGEASKEKPMTVKDYERKIILEKEGKVDEECGPFISQEDAVMIKEDKNIKKTVGFEDDNLSDSDDEGGDGMAAAGLLKKKELEVNDKVVEKDHNDAIAFLKGKKEKLDNAVDNQLLGELKKDWESNMNAADKYLMDYFVNQRYLEDEDETAERAPNHYALDIESLSEDEETFNKMEQYETKYRFRYEEPDDEFIKRHPRIITDTLRKKDTRRKETRQQKKIHEEEKELRRKQEIKRMKAFRRKEIMERIEKLKEVAGIQDERFEEIDLDEDFDPDKHDAAMAKLFNEDYYTVGDERERPLIEDEDIRRELEEEYDKLEQLESAMEGSYKYKNVFANSYGLTTEEIVMAKDSELNRWYSLKKILRYERSDELERRDKKNYQHRSAREDIKKKILPSLFSDNIEEQLAADEERKRKRNLKKKERKLRKRTVQENAVVAHSSKEGSSCGKESAVVATDKKSEAQKIKSKSCHKIANEKMKNEADGAEDSCVRLQQNNELNEYGALREKKEPTGESSSSKKKRKKRNKALENLEYCNGNSEEKCPSSKKKRKNKNEPVENHEVSNNDDSSEIVSSLSKKRKLLKTKKKALVQISDQDPAFEIDPAGNSSELHNTEETEMEEHRILHKRQKSKSKTENNLGASVYPEGTSISSKNQKWKHNEDTKKGMEKAFDLEDISDRRLAAYGTNPKKLRKRLKYSDKL